MGIGDGEVAVIQCVGDYYSPSWMARPTQCWCLQPSRRRWLIRCRMVEEPIGAAWGENCVKYHRFPLGSLSLKMQGKKRCDHCLWRSFPTPLRRNQTSWRNLMPFPCSLDRRWLYRQTRRTSFTQLQTYVLLELWKELKAKEKSLSSLHRQRTLSEAATTPGMSASCLTMIVPKRMSHNLPVSGHKEYENASGVKTDTSNRNFARQLLPASAPGSPNVPRCMLYSGYW